MNGRNLPKIKKHLEDKVAQERVRQNILRGRNEVMVSIGQAARVFSFSESQLRDWEKSGLLKPTRPKEATGSGNVTKQRQYSFEELDKLAIIHELINFANLTPGSIPPDIDKLWYSLTSVEGRPQGSPHGARPSLADQEYGAHWRNDEEGLTPIAASRQDPYKYILRRVETAYRNELGWRHYASRALLLALMLLYEDIPNTYAGLILPAQCAYSGDPESDPVDLANLGESLVGWLGLTRSFYTFLTPEPAFEFPSDYRVLPLSRLFPEDNTFSEDRTLLVVQRDNAATLQIDPHALSVAHRLLVPLYEDRQDWYTYFGDGVRDLVYPGMDFTPRVSDAVLTSLADMVVHLGGKNHDGQDRWQFCCIMLPDNPRLPLQQRSLVVRAKSARADRHIVGVTTVLPERYGTSLSLRAYQSGHIIYRPELAREDTTAQFQKLEGPICSNIAVPVGGETDPPLGVLYVASYDSAAFSLEDQRLLRVMARIIEELLRTYQARQQVTMDLVTLIDDPITVDSSFKEFSSETDFMQDLEALLTAVRQRIQPQTSHISASLPAPLVAPVNAQQEISFIAIELDGQERVANRYGDQTLKNLYKSVGLRIWGLLPALFTQFSDCKLYYMCAGRFYLVLHGFSLEKTRSNAERLRKALEGSILVRQSDLPGGSLIVPKLSAHLAVTWYAPEKLEEFLDPTQHRSIADVSSTLYHTLDFALNLGMNEGGNVIITWDRDTLTYVPYSPDDDSFTVNTV